VKISRRSLRRTLNYYLAKAEMMVGRNRLWSYPSELCIDVSNKCNLQCPHCPTGRGEQGGRGRGNITYDLFHGILDELAPYAYSLELFNWGEPFFNRDLPRLICDASSRGLRTIISSNLSFPLAEEQVRAIVSSGLSHLAAAVDGADQRSYEIYRRRGNFDLVMQNLRSFVRVKRELGVAHPFITWQYLVFAHNEGHIDEARKLSAELGLDNFSVLGGLYDDPSWAPKGDYTFNYLKVGENRCSFLWKKAVFHWDGGMASCCMGFNKHDDFDSFQPGQFRGMWNNDKFVAARRIWTAPRSPLPEGHFCVGCDKVKLYRGLPMTSTMKPTRELEPYLAAAGE
jgi:hypothetical protein